MQAQNPSDAVLLLEGLLRFGKLIHTREGIVGSA